MGLFQTLRQSEIAAHVTKARNFVIYAAPGVSSEVAAALLHAANLVRPDNVVAVLDVSAHSARMGYGCVDSAQRLADAGIDVRMEAGLRQGLLIVDNRGWAFTLPAQFVEADARENETAPNAIELTMAQIRILRGEIPQPACATLQKEAVEIPLAGRVEAKPLTGSEETPSIESTAPITVGKSRLMSSVIRQVKNELEVAPPQPFDLARQVRVYTALVRFVELEMKGWKIENRRVKLPNTLPVLATQDRELKQRIKSSLQLIDRLRDGRLRQLRTDVEEIRKAYCVPVGGLGSIALVQAQQHLINRVSSIKSRLAEAQTSIKAEIDAALKRMTDSLVPELGRAILRDPPDAFLGHYGNSPSREDAQEYVRNELARVFPTADEIVSDMSLRLTFKDVTYEVLKDNAFKDKVLTSFPRSVLPGELHREYDAARERIGRAGTLGFI